MPQLTFDNIKDVINNLCLMNNQFMNKMLEDNKPAAEIMLRVILKNDKIKVKNVRVQDFIQNLYGHSAQLDILAQDENGRYFNVEVQRNDEGAPPKRARFYSSILDMHFLKPGKAYEDLPESYVIFITENDVLQENLPLYSVDRIVKENNKTFADGSHIVYVNSTCQDDTPLGKLMQDFYCTNPDNLNYKEFSERMMFLKSAKEGKKEMIDPIEIYANNKAEKAAAKAAKKATITAEYARSAQIAQRLLEDGESAERTARLTNLSIEDVRKLAEKLSA